MFDDSITKFVFWFSVFCICLGMISIGILLSIAYGVFFYG